MNPDTALNPEAAADEADIRHLIGQRARAVGDKDVDALVSMYAPNALLYEVLPPLTRSGSEVKGSTESWFSSYQGSIGYDVHDVSVTVAGDVAFSHYLYLVTGTLKGGDAVRMGVRATLCWRKVDDSWFIVHEHQSVPFDPNTGKALTSLEP